MPKSEPQKNRKQRKKKGSKQLVASTPVNLTPISESRNSSAMSGLTDYPDDWEDDDILMRSPTPKYNYRSISGLSIDRSVTALEPLESPRKDYSIHSSHLKPPHESSSETSPSGEMQKTLLPPISVNNLPSINGQRNKTRSFNHLPFIGNVSESKKQEKIISELRQAGIVKAEDINSSRGGLAYAIDVKEGSPLGPRKPPHFLEKLPAIPTRGRMSSHDSWQSIIEEKQRIAGARHEEYINTIAGKARQSSARRRRAAEKMREQLRQSKQSIEERLRLRLSTFEENKNALMKEKLEKIRKMREREKRARKRLQKQIRVLQREAEIYDELKKSVAEHDRPSTKGGHKQSDQ